MNYGVVHISHIQDTARYICSLFGNKEAAEKLLLETACAETGLGFITDKSLGAGMGICQFDKMPFYDVKERSLKYKKQINDLIGVDISLVEWEHLRYNLLLSFLFCRLKYLLIPESIPSTIEGRAEY
jgi:hypothetical protein